MVLVVLLLLLLVGINYVLHRQRRTYIGMSRDEAQQRLGKPAGEIAVGTCACAYYESWPSPHGDPVTITSPRVQSVSELPTFYDATQMLFDKEDKLVAYNWNGEGLYTYTKDGEFRSTGKGLAAVADTIGKYCE